MGYTLDRSHVYHRFHTSRQTTSHTHIRTSRQFRVVTYPPCLWKQHTGRRRMSTCNRPSWPTAALLWGVLLLWYHWQNHKKYWSELCLFANEQHCVDSTSCLTPVHQWSSWCQEAQRGRTDGLECKLKAGETQLCGDIDYLTGHLKHLMLTGYICTQISIYSLYLNTFVYKTSTHLKSAGLT